MGRQLPIGTTGAVPRDASGDYFRTFGFARPIQVRMSETMGDPNWLYSSVVQSSAAIVAIVGGFITSTLLLRSAERETIQARIEERTAEREVLERQRASVERRADLRRIDFLLGDEIEEVVKWHPLPDAETAQRRLKAEDIAQSVFAEAWRELVDSIEHERRLLEDEVKKYGFGPGIFSDWAEKHGIDMSQHSEWIAHHVFRAMLLASSPKRSIRSPDYLSFIGPTEEMRAAERDWQIHRRDTQSRELEGYEVEASGLAHRVAVADGEVAALESRLKSFRYPPHLWWNLVTLGVLSVTGILIPLLLMPQDPEDYEGWHKGLVIFGFLVGLVLVFGSVIALASPRGAKRLFLPFVKRFSTDIRHRRESPQDPSGMSQDEVSTDRRDGRPGAPKWS